MSATQIPVIQQFIDYLENHLCSASYLHQFKKVGPRCFFYKDEIDMVFVKVTDENLIIITDGENVVDHMEILFLNVTPGEDEEDLKAIFDDFLGSIVHKF